MRTCESSCSLFIPEISVLVPPAMLALANSYPCRSLALLVSYLNVSGTASDIRNTYQTLLVPPLADWQPHPPLHPASQSLVPHQNLYLLHQRSCLISSRSHGNQLYSQVNSFVHGVRPEWIIALPIRLVRHGHILHQAIYLGLFVGFRLVFTFFSQSVEFWLVVPVSFSYWLVSEKIV